LKCKALAPHFQIELTRTGRMDDMIIHTECSPSAESDAARQQAAQELSHHIKSTIGISCAVQVHPAGGVARSEGRPGAW